MSKSVGNVVAPQDIIDKYSADMMRFVDFFRRLPGDVHNSIVVIHRNTFRYLLGNLL